MPTSRALVAGTLAAVAVRATLALTLEVVPDAVERDSTAPVRLEIGDVGAGPVALTLHVDVDGDGTLDPEDHRVSAEMIADGAEGWSPNMASDLAPAVGTIAVELVGVTPGVQPNTVGSYLWRSEETSSGQAAVAPWTVLAGPGSQSVSGTVVDAVGGGPIGGAVVLLEPLVVAGEEVYRGYTALTDADGAFTLNVPDTLDCHHRGVAALHPGYVTDLVGQPHLFLSGSSRFEDVRVELTPASPVTGRLVYQDGPAAGDGVPGVVVIAESLSEPPRIAAGFSDADGVYALAATEGPWWIVPESILARQGAVRLEDDGVPVLVGPGGATAADLGLRAADAFLEGTHTDAAGVPLAGRWVAAEHCGEEDDCHDSAVLSDSDGGYVLGLIGAPAPAEHDYEVSTPTPAPGLVAEQLLCEGLTAGESRTGVDVAHTPAVGTLSGTVRDGQGGPLRHVLVSASSLGPCARRQSVALSGCDGRYQLPAADGLWVVEVLTDGLAELYRGIDVGTVEVVDVDGGDVEEVDLFVAGAIAAPDEPSASATPLRLARSVDSQIVVESIAGATAYNVYVDALGSWYAPGVSTGTLCTVTSWADNGDGTIALDVPLPVGAWTVVTASNGGGESSAGRASDGIERREAGSWVGCPLGP